VIHQITCFGTGSTSERKVFKEFMQINRVASIQVLAQAFAMLGRLSLLPESAWPLWLEQ